MVKPTQQPHGGVMHILEKGETANPNGRPRKIATRLKQAGYKQSEIYDTFYKIGALTKDEFLEFAQDENITLIELGVCKMFQDYIKKGKTELLDYILPKQKTIELKSDASSKFELQIMSVKDKV